MIAEVEKNIKQLHPCKETGLDFVYDFLAAFGLPASTITRLKRPGNNYASDPENEVLLRRKLLFRIEKRRTLYRVIDDLKHSPHTEKYAPRFIVVTDGQSFLAIDSHKNDTLCCPDFAEFQNSFVFFLPLAGTEKVSIDAGNPIDVKVAEKVAKLHDFVARDNPDLDEQAMHVFFARLLFCFFAEDTGIFARNLFTESVASHTKKDGRDLDTYLDRLFARLNDEVDSSKYPQYLKKFPYTNGGLFDKYHPIPKFSEESRKLIIDCGRLQWRDISPDIFGSIFQAAINREDRDKLGAHYTSPENIRKIIEPLFLNDLWQQLAKAGNSKKRLRALLTRLENLHVFDPACGCGNFLIVSYRELRRLEMNILDKLVGGQRLFSFATHIKLENFHGIEILPFACEIAKLSLYLVEHLANLEFKERFQQPIATLPLKTGGNIVCANALRIDWQDVCPRQKDREVYVVSNPPYVGSTWQTTEQRQDKTLALKGVRNLGLLDYVACWFHKGAKYIEGHKAELAFVSTNSLTQGEQVGIMWPMLLDMKIEIGFAYRSFKWANKAKGGAVITCVIISLRNICDRKKFIYDQGKVIEAKNINPYLMDGKIFFISRRREPPPGMTKMNMGNKPTDAGNLLLEPTEKEDLVKKYPESKKFLRKIVGGKELVQGIERWCLWISDDDVEKAMAIPEIKTRIDNVRKFRLTSSSKKLADKPHQFREFRSAKKLSLAVAVISSERRKYIPIRFFSAKETFNNKAYVIYDPPIYIFAIITSAMHMIWVKNFAGRFGTGYSYSIDLCYNIFPFPEITADQKYQLEEHTRAVIEAREQHSEKTLAQLYDPDKMPVNLIQAHQELDRYVESLYRKKPFASDDERLGCLIELYAKLNNEEKKRA